MIDWKNLKDVENITTDSLWITASQKNGKFFIPKREMFRDYNSNFHGLFIPEIPYQMIKRFTKPGGKIWDCFAGGGTTNYVADKIGRLQDVLSTDIVIDDNSYRPIKFADVLNEKPLKIYDEYTKFKMLFFHPPYHNIIKFSTYKNDLSNCNTLDEFIDKMWIAINNVSNYIDEKGFVILVCGNIWYDNEEIDLGVQIKEMFRKIGFKSRMHIIKDYGETKAKIFGQGYNLQYYRNIKNNTNFFYGDNIFVLQKTE